MLTCQFSHSIMYMCFKKSGCVTSKMQLLSGKTNKRDNFFKMATGRNIDLCQHLATSGLGNVVSIPSNRVNCPANNQCLLW